MATTRPDDIDIQQIIDYLQGTCTTLQDGVETFYPGMDEFDLTKDDHNAIANQIFLCGTCGWWCESHEQTDSGECDDCNQEEEDDADGDPFEEQDDDFDEDDENYDEDGNERD